MKKTFNIIKRIFKENKEYFIKCTIMSCIAALIIGFVIGLSVPASAADDPAESDQVIIPAGLYTFNNEITGLDSFIDYDVSIPFVAYPHIIYAENGNDVIGVDYDSGDSFTNISLNDSSLEGQGNSILFGFGADIVYSDVTYEGVFVGWDAYQYVLMSLGAEGSSLVSDYGQTIRVTSDTSVPSVFGTWFFDNVSGGGSVDPDPEPSYLITSGWYRFVENPVWSSAFSFDLPFSVNTDLGFGLMTYSCVGIDLNVGSSNELIFVFEGAAGAQDLPITVYTVDNPWPFPDSNEIYVTRDVTVSAFAYNWFTTNTYPFDSPAPDIPSNPDSDDGFLSTIVDGVTSIFNMQFLVIDGYVITFGGIFSACVGLSLFIWLLKVFAGG